MQQSWTFSEIWNDSLLTFDERTLIPRDYIYASELGGSFIDRYLRMMGTKPTNPPNDRSRRKFQAGNIWEWIIGFVLLRAGIMRKKQIRAEVTLPGLLRVSGRLDFVAGGRPDWEKSQYEIDHMDFPPFIEYATKKIIENFKKNYGDTELEELVMEVKSMAPTVFERAMKTKQANPNHVLQNFHYVFGGPYDFGKLSYVCKDDCRLLEFPVYKSAYDTQMDYQQDIQTMSDYYNAKQVPPKEQELLFDQATGRFNTNWKVEYSGYLTMIYKYQYPDDYRNTYKSMVASFNRVFKRCVNGDKMTDNNKIAIRLAKKYFPDFDLYVDISKKQGIVEVPEEEEVETDS
ncbi:MAG TPA: hypothetical protein VIQ51_04780 [Chryseosolibacter sp.]